MMESMFSYETYAEETRCLISHDLDAIFQVELIANTIATISRSHGDLYTLKTDKFTRRFYMKANRTGEALYQCLKSPTSEILKYFHTHTLNPYVGVYIKAVRQHSADGIASCDLNTYLDDTAHQLVQHMNALVQTLRVLAHSPEFKKAIQASQRSCNKNRKNFIKYVKALLLKNHRIRGLRMEFSYSNNHNFDQAESDISYYEAKSHREALVAEIRKRFKGVLLGFVWKFKYGLLQGYHSHVLIFLDGSQVPEDVTIVKALGEHWCSILTGGKGAYLNCNSDQPSYRLCGIGELLHDDPLIWKRLENIATYLTKLDHYVRLKMPGKDRSLGKGGPPKLYAKKKKAVDANLKTRPSALELRSGSRHPREMGSLLP